MPLVAAVVVIAVVVAVVVGEKMLRGDDARQAGSSHSLALPSLVELEARPLVVASDPTGPCVGEKSGPVEFKYSTVRFSGDKALYASAQAFTYGGVEGLVLSRIRDLRTDAPTIFYVNDNAAGAVLGTDIVMGETVEMRPEVVFDTAHPRGKPDSIGRASWTVTWGWLPSHSDCTVVQTDGTYKGAPFVQFSVYEG